MTINVAVVTSDALILGCDSVASTTQWFLDPFNHEAVEPNDDGTFRLNFALDQLTETVTNAWGGVTKMFQISEWPMAAAVTSGLAKLNGSPTSSLVDEFLAEHRQPAFFGLPGADEEEPTVEELANSFLQFMRERYDENYRRFAGTRAASTGSVIPRRRNRLP